MSKLYVARITIILSDVEEMVDLPPVKVWAQFNAGDPRELLTVRALGAALETARISERFIA